MFTLLLLLWLAIQVSTAGADVNRRNYIACLSGSMYIKPTKCKFKPETVEMWLVLKISPAFKFAAVGVWFCEDSLFPSALFLLTKSVLFFYLYRRPVCTLRSSVIMEA